MKKLLFAISLFCCGVLSAAELDLSFANMEAWDSSTQINATTGEVTFGSAWTAVQWWVADDDLTAYTSFIIECEAVPFKLEAGIEGTGGLMLNTEVSNATFIQVKFTAAQAANIQKLYLKSENAATVKILRAYLSSDEVVPVIPDTKQLLFSDLSQGWGTVTFDQTAQTITFGTDDWGCAAQWWLGEADWSDYNALVLEIQPATVKVSLTVEYSDGTYKEGIIEVGDAKTSVALDAEKKANVQKAYIKAETTTTTTFVKCYLTKDGSTPENPDTPVTPVKAQDLSISELGGAWSGVSISGNVLTFPNSNWDGGIQWWFGSVGDGQNWAQWDSIVMEIEPTTMKVGLKVEYNGGAAETEMYIEAGDNRVSALLDAEGKTDVQKAFIVAEGPGSFAVKRVYLTVTQQGGTSTALDETSAPIFYLGNYRYQAAEACSVYDLQGRWLMQSGNGIVDMNSLSAGMYILRAGKSAIKVLR